METSVKHDLNEGLDPGADRSLARLRTALRKRFDTRLRATMLAEPVYYRRAVTAAPPDARILLHHLAEHEADLLEAQERRMRGLGEARKADVLGFVRTRILREVTAELLPLLPGEPDARAGTP